MQDLVSNDREGLPSAEVILETVGVSVRFGGVKALEDVAVSVKAGEICGLIGPNGAGKTTLFDVLSGVRPPTSGSVLLQGTDVTDKSPTWRARHGVRRTFQRQQVFGGMTVEDNVLTALEWHGGGGGLCADLIRLPTRSRRERLRRLTSREAIERCGLSDATTSPAESSSIGTARLLELSRAIVDEPVVLLLDEPTSGLDEHERDRLGELIQEQRARGTAIVLVEHDVEFVTAQCDRIVVLNLGEVIADGPTHQVREDPRVIAAYLT